MKKLAQPKFIKKTLYNVFGFENLRPGQIEVIQSVLSGKNTLAVMPTGAGKSLCYQLPALEMPGMTVIVSPLISLMKDQVDKLEEKGLEAAQLNSAIERSEQAEAIEKIASESSEFIFTTPERLANPEFLKTLTDKNIDLFVIDEAHCLSQWGHDFRPAFLELRNAIEQLRKPVVLGLTATATPEVIEDIKKQLQLPEMQIINAGIFRSNLQFEVVQTTNELEKKRALIKSLREIGGSKIVYCATVRAVEEVTEFLQQMGFSAEKYHGKMTGKQRIEAQERFMNNEIETIVATNAFGMGIDKPDIRAVIHWQMPGNLEAYHQEAGRAGRDGAAARCILLFDVHDRRTQAFFLGGRYPKPDDMLAIYQALHNLKADQQAVSLAQIQETVGNAVAQNKIRVALNLLKDENVLKEIRGLKFKLLKTDLSLDEIDRFAQAYEERSEKDRAKLERMMLYASSAFCRWHVLHEYFADEMATERCGICDNCQRPIAEKLQVKPISSHSKEAEVRAQLENEIKQEDNFKIKPKDLVTLPQYGEGEVRQIESDKITVVSPNGTEKIFKKEFVHEIKRKTAARK